MVQGVGEYPTETEVHQKQERSLLGHERRGRWSHCHFGMVDDIIVASTSMTVITDVKKVQEAVRTHYERHIEKYSSGFKKINANCQGLQLIINEKFSQHRTKTRMWIGRFTEACLDHLDQHWLFVKQLLGFLQSSKGLLHKKGWLSFSGRKWCRLVWWCELQKINDGLPVQAQWTWSHTKLGCQKAGYMCSSEAEYQGKAAEVQGALYFKQLLDEFGIQQKYPLAIGENKQSCIRLCQNAVVHKRSKHMGTIFYFIREKTEEGTNSIHAVPIENWLRISFRKC